MEVTLSVFGTFVRFVDMGSTWVNLLCYPFVAVTSITAAVMMTTTEMRDK